jgi:hypothetical protein
LQTRYEQGKFHGGAQQPMLKITGIRRMPPPTTANVAGIGDFLTQVAGSIVPRRARGVRNGRRAVNSVQSGAVMAHVSR